MSLNVTWQMYRNGDNPPVTVSTYYKRANGSDWILWSNETTNQTDYDMFANIVDLLPETDYDVLIVALNSRSTDNQSEYQEIGWTRAQPEVTLETAEVDDGVVRVTWDYAIETSSLSSDQYQVTVQAEYWNKNDVDNKKRCPDTPVNVQEESLQFEDGDVNEEYLLTLIVFENGNENTQISEDDDPKNVYPVADVSGLGGGAIAGIAIVCIAVVMAPAVLFVMYKKRIIKPSYDEDPNITTSEPAVEYSNCGSGTNMENAAAAIYAQPVKKAKRNGGPAADKGDGLQLYENVSGPKPKLKPKPPAKPSNGQSARIKDEDGLIYITASGLEFPKHRLLPSDQQEVIHGADDQVEYASVDHGKVGPPPIPEVSDEEDIFDTLPDREPVGGDDEA